MGRTKVNIKNARRALMLHLKEIYTVQEWADYMGYDSARTFTHVFKKQFGIPPYEAIIEERLGCIRGIVAADSNLETLEIAKKAGLRNEKALYNFLRRHAKTTLSALRHELDHTA